MEEKCCDNCYYSSGEGDFRFCLHEAHPGMAFRKTAVCDHWQSFGVSVPKDEEPEED